MADSSPSYDVVIIGSGPGGYVAAIRASQLGLRTAIVERAELGGVCLNWGCIPTKALLRSADLYDLASREFKGHGIKTEDLTVDFKKVHKRSRTVATKNRKGVEFLMKKNGIDVHVGEASIPAPGTVQVRGRDGEGATTLQAPHIVIATGARTRDFPDMPIDGERVLGSKGILQLSEIPESLVVVGAGAIGIEFAFLFAVFGTRVTVIEMLDRILPVEDPEVTEVLAKSLKKRKVDLQTEARVQKVINRGDDVTVSYTDAAGEAREAIADYALIAVGVQPNTEGLGIKALGLATEKGWVTASRKDGTYRTSVEGIYAIGDVNGPPWLAHKASHEGMLCIESIAAGMGKLPEAPHPLNYDAIPGCTYCEPQVASVGLSEAQAVERGIEVQVGRFPFMASGKARALGREEGLVKVIVGKPYGEILGASLVGPEVTELVDVFATAIASEATWREVAHAVHAHPTLAEGLLEATLDSQGRAIHI